MVIQEIARSQDQPATVAEHLIDLPDELAAYAGAGEAPERFAVLRRPGGSLAIFHSIAAEKIGSWWPWGTEGAIESVAALLEAAPWQRAAGS